MLQVARDGTLIAIDAANDSAGHASGTIELPVDLLDEQSDLMDCILSFAFDVLNLRTIELRIRPRAAEGANVVHPRSI